MLRRLALTLALALLAASPAWAAATAAWPNVTTAPTATDRTVVATHDFAETRDALAAALAKNYQPGGSTGPGSTGRTGYKSWLLLYKWSELLARNEMDEVKRLLAPRLYERTGNATPSLLGPGVTPTTEMFPAPAEDIKKFLDGTRNLAPMLRVLTPTETPAPYSKPLATLLPPEILAEWTADEDFLRDLFDTLSPQDYAPNVLRNLLAIRQTQPTKFKEYRALALAIAVVDDQKVPAFWPHRQVTHDLVPLQPASPADWFAYWVRANEAPGMYFDLRKLGAEQLKFVVDAPLDETELDWARKNVRRTRDDFAKAFSDIVYSTRRVQLNGMTWNDDRYTLENIKKLGGICVDQAYFAMVSGKAHGLPTLFFAGQGVDGGHAWFGYLKGADRWELDCGRYENQNLAVGLAFDPQTWTTISDHQLAFLTERFHSRPEYAASRDDVVLGGLLEAQGDTARAAKAYDSAIAVSPRNVEAWDAKTSFLERTGTTAAALTAHHQAALRQFSSVPDVKAAHQKALAALAASAGNLAQAGALTHEITQQNQDARSDIAVGVAVDKIAALLKAQKFPEAVKEHEAQLSTLGRKVGGDFFYKVTRPLVQALLKNNLPNLARQVLDAARAALKPEPNNLLARDMQTLQDTLPTAAAKKN